MTTPDDNLPTVNNGNAWQPEALAKEEDHIQQTLLGGYQDALVSRGCSADKLARQRMAQLNARKIQLTKIKGHLPQQLKLPAGYRVVTPTERMVFNDPETGKELVVDPGETIIQHAGPDWATRERALNAIETIMGYRTEQQPGGDGRTVIIVNSMMPLPEPPPSKEALALVHGTDDNSSPTGGNGNGNNGGGGGHA